MIGRSLLAIACFVLVAAHLTGNMKPFLAAFDIGIETKDLIYLAALPFACISALMMLRD